MFTCPLYIAHPALAEQGARWAALAQQPYAGLGDPRHLSSTEFILWLDQTGLKLQQTGRKAPGPVWVDFAHGAADHRRQYGGGRGQMVAKAVGLKPGVNPQVLDATAGLGGDAFVLACLGAQVHMQERNPVVYSLLADGVARLHEAALNEATVLQPIAARISLASAVCQSGQQMETADVVYLDPMFPSREKSAAVKKEMTAFHSLVGEDPDQDVLLEQALAVARYRVVVKRPRKAPWLANQKPALELTGKSSRFDIYTLKKMPDRLPEQDG